MTIDVHTEPGPILAALDVHLARDPISGTVLGSIRGHIATAPEPAMWAATGPDQVAARSAAELPVVVAGDWSGSALADLLDALRELPDLAGVSGPVALVERIVAGLGRRPLEIEPLKLYRLDELAPPAVEGTARDADRADLDLLRAYYRGFHLELDGHAGRGVEVAIERALSAGGAVWWLVGGEPVSLAVRQPVQHGSARIGPVFTPLEHRGHGYAAAATAEATAQVLAEGAIPVLFTDAENAATNQLYPRLGYYLIEDQVRYYFR